MKQVLSILCAVFLLSATGPLSAKGHVDKGVQGWITVGADIWSTDAGVVTANEKAGKSYLVSLKQYSNFTLTLEFWPDEKVNSGVFVNCNTAISIGSKNCFEANISDNHKKPEFRTGSIVRHAPPASKVSSIGQWNKMVFTVNDGKVIVEINGVVTAEADASAHPSGYIALQRFKDGVIKFRNIQVTPL